MPQQREIIELDASEVPKPPPTRFNSAYNQLDGEFKQKYGRPLKVTGDSANNPMHRRPSLGGQAFDVRSKDLSKDEQDFVTKRSKELGLHSINATGRESWASGPHIHIDKGQARGTGEFIELDQNEVGKPFTWASSPSRKSNQLKPVIQPAKPSAQAEVTGDQPHQAARAYDPSAGPLGKDFVDTISRPAPVIRAARPPRAPIRMTLPGQSNEELAAQRAATDTAKAQREEGRRTGANQFVSGIIGKIVGKPDLRLPRVVTESLADVGGNLAEGTGAAVQGAGKGAEWLRRTLGYQDTSSGLTRIGQNIRDVGTEVSQTTGAPEGVRKDIGAAVGQIIPALIAKNPATIAALTATQAKGRGAEDVEAIKQGAMAGLTVGAMGKAAGVIGRLVPEAGIGGAATRFGMRAAVNTAIPPLLNEPVKALEGNDSPLTTREMINAAVMGTGFAAMPHPVEPTRASRVAGERPLLASQQPGLRRQIESKFLNTDTARAQYEAQRAAQEQDVPAVPVKPTETGVESALTQGISARQPLQSPRLVKRAAAQDIKQSSVGQNNAASVPFMITRAQRADLGSRGYSESQINAMKPAEAHDILAQAQRGRIGAEVTNGQQATSDITRTAAGRNGLEDSQSRGVGLPADAKVQANATDAVQAQNQRVVARSSAQAGTEAEARQSARQLHGEPDGNQETIELSPAEMSEFDRFVQEQTRHTPTPTGETGLDGMNVQSTVPKTSIIGDSSVLPEREGQAGSTGQSVSAAASGERSESTAKGLTRNFRAGLNDASMTFADETHRDLYDLGAKMRYQPSGRVNQRAVGDVVGLRKSLAQRLNLPEADVSRMAMDTLADVKVQMKGVKHLEERRLSNNVQAPKKTVTTVKAHTPANRNVKPESDSLLAAIQKLGFDFTTPEGADLARYLSPREGGRPGMVNNNRLPNGERRGIDTLVTELQGHGFDVKDANDLYEKVRQEQGGKPVYSTAYDHAGAAERDLKAHLEANHPPEIQRAVMSLADGIRNHSEFGELSDKIAHGEATYEEIKHFANIGRYELNIHPAAIESFIETHENAGKSQGRGAELGAQEGQQAERVAERATAEGDVDGIRESRTSGTDESLSGQLPQTAKVEPVTVQRQRDGVLPAARTDYLHDTLDRLTEQARATKRTLTELVEEHLAQRPLPGQESTAFTPEEASMARSLAASYDAKGRRSPVKERQQGFEGMDVAPTTESKAAQARDVESQQGAGLANSPLFEGENKPQTFYHVTSPENAEAIRKEGFKPSEDGELGKGVYVIENPDVLTHPRYKEAERLKLSTDAKILDVGNGPNYHLEVYRALHGRERGTAEYEKAGQERFDDDHMQTMAKAAGYDGIRVVGASTPRNTVIFDPKKLSVEEAPHHSSLQPRNDAGEFSGPSDYTLTPEKIAPPARTAESSFKLESPTPEPPKGNHGQFINALFKSPDVDAQIPAFWANPEVRAKLGLPRLGKMAETKDALAKAIGKPRSSHLSPDDVRQWAAENGLSQDALTALDVADAQYRAKTSVRKPLPPGFKESERGALKIGIPKRLYNPNQPGQITKASEAISSIRKAGLLTSVKTHLRNVLGTGAFQLTEEISRIPGSMLDLVTSAVTKQRGLTGANPMAFARAGYDAATKGISEAVKIMKQGTPANNPAQIHAELNTKSPLLNAYVNTVFRALSAEDKVMRVYAYRRALEGRARAEALNERRMNPRLDVKARTAQLVIAPHARLMAESLADAEMATFNNDNALSTAIQEGRASLRQGGGAGKTADFAIDMIMPFDRTPTNIIARMLEYTPGGVAYGLSKTVYRAAAQKMTGKVFSPQEQLQFARTFGRGVTGSALIALGYALAASGHATSLYDEEDKAGNRYDKEAGRSPMAVKIDNKWLQIGSFSPLGNLIAIGATLFEKPGKATALIAKEALTEQPLMKGTADVLKASQSGDKLSDKAGYMAGSFIPSVVADIAEATDDKSRKSFGFAGQIKKRIPGVRQTLPGDEGVQHSRLWSVDPFRTTTEREGASLGTRTVHVKATENVKSDKPFTDADKDRSKAKRELVDLLRQHKDSEAEAKAKAMLDSGQVTEKELKLVGKRAGMGDLKYDMSRLSVSDALDLYESGPLSTEEKKQVREVILDKLSRLDTSKVRGADLPAIQKRALKFAADNLDLFSPQDRDYIKQQAAQK